MSSTYPVLTERVNHPLLPAITDRRLGLFVGGHYAAHNLSAALDRARLRGGDAVRMTLWSAPGQSKPTFDEAVAQLALSSRELHVGDELGPSWTNHWVRVDLAIPESFRDSGEPVIFEFDPNCEALIYNLDGHPLHGISGGPNSMKDGQPGTAEDRRVDHIVPREAVAAGHYSFYVELSINAMFGLGLNGFRHQQPDMNVHFRIDSADIVLARSEARSLYIDFKVLTQMARGPGTATSSLQRQALRAANDIMNVFKIAEGRENDDELDRVVAQCRAIAAGVIGRPNDEELVKDTARVGDDAQLWGIGHCHIDTAWLWRYTQTQQKIGRSWSSQVDLMNRYPEHQFAASSAQQFVWLKEYYPSLFDAVKGKVKAGQFHPVGGSWLEHDCMIPSGESLCRQYLYGQRYFTREFGVRAREAWLPDTFGYASQLPQILRLAGIDYFFTQKLCWNQMNPFPYSTFNWAALDGTQVLAHMTPVDNYNAQVDYDEIVKGASTNKNLGVTNQCLMLFGNGDGGGGPTALMLEKMRRDKAIAARHREMPSIKMGRVLDFFETIRHKTDNGALLPTWRGELYFELHRGTYTSQAGIKRGNRVMERLLRDTEYYASLASIHAAEEGYAYPRAALDAIWKDVLLNQFHDVLPGTSIAMANEDAMEIYARREAEVRALLDAALGALVPQSAAMNGVAPASSAADILVLDPTRLARTEVVHLSAGVVDLLDVPSQVLSDGSALAFARTADTGVGGLVAVDSIPPAATAHGSGAYTLSNADFSLTITNGRIASLRDVQLDRELILPSARASSGGLMLYEDLPPAYDAWDVEIYHLDAATELVLNHVEVIESGPLRASLKATASVGKSVVALTFSLDATLPGASSRSTIRVDVDADWRERHKFLKFALPVDIHAPNATYGNQFGLVERPTHRNTSDAQAKFEVCGHMFADLSEPGYGVTFAADWKYGYAVEGSVMRLSLLRSCTAPDPEQDQGHHAFSFGIMPHTARFQESGAYKQAMRFVNDVYVRTTTGAAPSLAAASSFAVVGPNADSIILEAIKRGEDDDERGAKTLVLRLFESQGGRARGTLELTGLRVAKLQWVNILEEPLGPEVVTSASDAGSTRVELDFRAFEIKTLHVYLD
ncbi:Alpha-mannosidase [Vanrija pseudolonga]|uniref:alpha-mannosidase n=1 Tax=Vanrija pseudolonga TaxID=143232 RepID=A0AAF1BQR9_9TREE|nr:Alpha-mannosidase [Vanrija pseudolonga]